MTKGRVYLIGAGPGDPALITVRGRDLLGEADVVVYDHLASPRLLDYARGDAEMIYVGKQASRHTLSQDEINDLLVSLARRGSTVARLKGGDPYVFGRGGEEALALVEAGIAFEVVPGVTAGIAAACYAGIPVTHRTLASNLGFVTGHETPDKEGSDLDYRVLAKWGGTLAFYMGVANLPAICKGLIDCGLDDQTPAALIRWGTTSRQRVVTGSVSSLPRAAKDAGMKPPALIVIGEVVSLRAKLNWFERRCLFGRRIVVTRARAQASALTARLERLGAEVIEMPTIRIEPPDDPRPLDQSVAELDSFDWIIFTSANGVDAFFSALQRGGLDSRALGANRICTIGPATAERLARWGLRPDAQPTKFLGAEIVKTLADLADLKGVGILCPRADIAPADLIDALEERGAVVRNVTAYRTVADDSAAEQVGRLLGDDDLHWITFTSSSTVKNFFGVIDPRVVRARRVRLASIGPATSAAIGQFDLRPDIEAKSHTIEGLVDAILNDEGVAESRE